MTAQQYQAQYGAVVNATGCASASNTLACLRQVPIDTFISATNGTSWGPTVDGVFLKDYPTTLISKGQYAKVPLLLGANTDEGTAFGPRGNNDEADIAANLARRYPTLKNASIDRILELYQDDPFHGCPYNTGDGILPTGIQDKRALSIWGDIYMHAGVTKVHCYHMRGSHNLSATTSCRDNGEEQECLLISLRPGPAKPDHRDFSYSLPRGDGRPLVL
jgi:acetylcholinesterase